MRSDHTVNLLCKVLEELIDSAEWDDFEAELRARDMWRADVGGRSEMEREPFMDGFFKLADLGAAGTSGEEYGLFLRRLRTRCGNFKGDWLADLHRRRRARLRSESEDAGGGGKPFEVGLQDMKMSMGAADSGGAGLAKSNAVVEGLTSSSRARGPVPIVEGLTRSSSRGKHQEHSLRMNDVISEPSTVYQDEPTDDGNARARERSRRKPPGPRPWEEGDDGNMCCRGWGGSTKV